ncbi:restriction endonuclease subunit S [Lactococcus lactis]|uniref:restriction endonuclease subunit S n=1 Tax=Lactococcus lactis TaxID=1358 RepID=UPI0024160400|nr:restriction endonuclease subunit S [Lactococcus lactis]MDG4958840.1 restriction endonuclease subunit S [Lactococcus lactis]
MPSTFLNHIKAAEVEWKALGAVCEIADNARKPVKSDQRISGEVPYYGANNIQDYVDGFTHDGEYVLIAEDGSTSLEHYSIQFVTGKFWANNHVHVVKGNDGLISRFLFHYLSQFNFQKYLTGGTRAKLTKQQMLNIPIPIPSLEIQQKVVEILDKMTDYVTELTAELTAELTLRQKQYAYYRDQLLTFPSQSVSDESVSVKWMTLGEIGEVRMCKRILKSQTSSTGEVPFFKIGTFGKKPNAFISRALFEEYKEKYSYPKVGDLLISASGTIGRIVKFDGKDAYFQDSNIVWIDNDETQVRNDYLRYYYQIANWGTSQGGTITRLYNDGLKKMKIAVPPLELQYKIVEILDKFDKLTSDLPEGLLREIELRKKQYEYWRERLLNFKK